MEQITLGIKTRQPVELQLSNIRAVVVDVDFTKTEQLLTRLENALGVY